MARPYSLDPRERVVAAVKSEQTCRMWRPVQKDPSRHNNGFAML